MDTDGRYEVNLDVAHLSEERQRNLMALLERHVGMTIEQLGNLEIDEDFIHPGCDYCKGNLT